MPDFAHFDINQHSDDRASEFNSQTEGLEHSIVLQDRYRLIKSLGQGGMGSVFLAQDKRLSNRFCVVKKLRLEGFDKEDRQKATAFFEREANILSQLKHPNIVAIQDYFQENGNYFLVMEYVKGDNLQQLLRKRGEPFTEKQVVDWASTILVVLDYLHGHNPPVIYRDIKPSNIMLGTTDGIKLVDFGIARPYIDQESTHIVSGGYSPPEQYWGAADLRSDIYALGSTMYYLLTGKEPLALQTCHVSNYGFSEFLDKIIQRATAQDVWLRYQTANEMRQALSAIPQKEKRALLPKYALLSLVLACVSVICATIFFFTGSAESSLFRDKAMSLFAGENRGAIPWRIPFEIASLASNEEIITDPEGLSMDHPAVAINMQNGHPESAGNYFREKRARIRVIMPNKRR